MTPAKIGAAGKAKLAEIRRARVTFDTSKPEAQRREAELVLENVIGSALNSLRRHIKNPKKHAAPKAAGYAKILIADLQARGWTLERRK